MKATKGTQLTCSACKQVVGTFRKDVADDAPVTSEDVDIDGGVAIPSYQDRGSKWNCLKCKVSVAELAVGQPSRWSVHTARGWLS